MENSGWRQRRGGYSRGRGGMVGRVRSWVVSSARGQRGDGEAGPPRAAQRRAHSRQSQKCRIGTRKHCGHSRDVCFRPPGNNSMLHNHKSLKNSGDGETWLGRMVGTAARKTQPAAVRSPEDHHSGPRPRLRGRCKGSPLWKMTYKQHDCPSRNDYIFIFHIDTKSCYILYICTIGDEYHVYTIHYTLYRVYE